MKPSHHAINSRLQHVVLRSERYVPLLEENVKERLKTPSEVSTYSEPHLQWPTGRNNSLDNVCTKATQTEEKSLVPSEDSEIVEIIEVNSLTVECLDAAIKKNSDTLLRLRPSRREGFPPLLSPSRSECNDIWSSSLYKKSPSQGILRTFYYKSKTGELLPVSVVEHCEKY